MPSALASLGLEGFENPLHVPDVERVAVLLVDGLGWRQLRRHADVAPFLSAVAEGAAGTGRPISTPFPSTTATSLASIGTGLPPGSHGLVGYAFRVPGHDDRVMNALRWQLYGQGPQVGLRDELPPATFQPFATMFERAMTRSLRWHDEMRSGELVSRLTTDVGRVLDGIVALTTSFLPDAVMLIGVLVLLLAFDPGLLAKGFVGPGAVDAHAEDRRVGGIESCGILTIPLHLGRSSR